MMLFIDLGDDGDAMRFRKLDLNLLVVLDALIAEQSVSQAARRLHLTQPAVSNALARLRQHFHDDLLVKRGRQMMPTPLATSLRAPVRDALLQVQSIAEARPYFDASTAELEFTIVASDYVSATFLPKAVRRLTSVAPGIRINVVPLSERNFARLEHGEVDLAITPLDVPESVHPSCPLFEEKFTSIAWSRNNDIPERLSLDAYLAQTHVVAEFDDSRDMLPFDAVYLRERGHERKIAAVAFNFTLLPHMVVGTPYLATVQARLAKQYLKTMPLKIVSPQIDFPIIAERLQWHHNRDRDLANMWLRDFLTGIAATH